MKARFAACLRSFVYSYEGLRTLWQTEQNARIECAALAAVVVAGWFLRLSSGEWMAVALVSTLVLSLEAMNTALEAVVDLASPDIHPLAKRAKDLAAAAVLIAAIGSIVIAAFIVVPRLIAPVTAC